MKVDIEVEFAIGATVEFRNKIGKDEGIVTGYSVRQGGVSYAVTWSDKSEKYHYGFELKSKP